MPTLSLILIPGFHLSAYALVVETLRMANRVAGETVFTWDTRAPRGRPSTAACGAVITPDHTDWRGGDALDLVLLIAGQDLPEDIGGGPKALMAAVDAAGGTVGGVDTGTLALARLGLLDGHRAVLFDGPNGGAPTPWPAIRPSDAAACLDRARLTGAGGIAAVDTILAWIAQVASTALAEATRETLADGRIRLADMAGRQGQTADPVIAEMERLMQANLSSPLPLTDIAARLGLSRKALRGRCARALGVTPSERYLVLRLLHGADLLRNTAMPVTEIAADCGFDTLAGFSRSVRAQLGTSPTGLRKTARSGD